MEKPLRERVLETFERLGGNVSATARSLGVTRSTVQRHVRKAGANKKPLAAGSVGGTPTIPCSLPSPGKVKRFLLTSAQNNTRLFEPLWRNLSALEAHYGAELLVGSYTYNQNAYGPLSVKAGTKKAYQTELWYDERVRPYLADARRELAPGLVWCGEMNILPTSPNPLSELETYAGQSDTIFPHAKIAMRSIATMKDEPAKHSYTTGTVTLRNYLQKKAGLVAEHHHAYAALLVEVNSDGAYFVRQIHADEKGRIQDLDVIVDKGVVTTGNRVESITWGDIHSACLDAYVAIGALGEDGMLDTLKPRTQFLGDVYEGIHHNHHESQNPHSRFRAMLRGYDTVEAESKTTGRTVNAFRRPFVKTIVVDSNHDSQWLWRWLREHDYRRDPRNALYFLRLQLAAYEAIEKSQKLNITKAALAGFVHEDVRFLDTDESYTICGGRIECGMHGHLGPNGARGGQNLAKVGRRANIGHIHSAGIYDGLYVAGTSCTLDMGFNAGPSGWSHSHIVTYPNGRRTIITMRNGKWRA